MGVSEYPTNHNSLVGLAEDGHPQYMRKAGDTASGVIDFTAGATSSRVRGVGQFIGTNEATTSTAYTDLATVGPSVTFLAPPSGVVAVFYTAWMTGGGTAGNQPVMSVEFVSSTAGAAETFGPSDLHGAVIENSGGSGQFSTPAYFFAHLGLTPGATYTVRAKYRTSVSGGTANFLRRRLIAIPSL